MEADIKLMVIAIVKPDYRNLHIVNVYRPLHLTDVDEFLAVLHDTITSLKEHPHEIWVLGDFNIDMRMRNETNTRNLIDLCRETGVKSLNQEVMWPNTGQGPGT